MATGGGVDDAPPAAARATPPAAPPPRDYGPLLRRILVTATVLAVLAATAHWAWRQPFMAKPRALYTLSRMPPPDALPVPVEGIAASRIADTFGAPRGRDRTHQGVDIFAARGTTVTSASFGVVVSVREGGLGGRQVWVLGPGRQRHYYAHLDDWAPGLANGDVVAPGDALGSVGDTGNARGTPPHLHYGIYGGDGAIDPLPLLRAVQAAGAAAR